MVRINIIEMEHVRFQYLGANKPVLNGINVTIRKNETVLLLGASGAGKSSFALCLNGLIPHAVHGQFSGTVRVQGKHTAETTVADLTRHVGLVFQDPEAQLVNMKVEDEVAFGLENLCLSPEEMDRRITSALAETGLSAYRHWPVDRLSGGQKQRLALASVLCMQPQILILDEPTANLDPAGTREVFSVLRQLKRSGKYTFILIEHKLDDLMDLVDRILLLGRNGTIIADGSPRHVFYEHASLLRQEGVWMPQCVQLTCALKERGIPLAEKPLTVDETVDMLTTFYSHQVLTDAWKADRRHEMSSSMDANLALEIKHHAFGKECMLQPMQLQVPQGDFLAIVGENGAGKSTLARHIMQLHKVNKDVIYIHGRDVTKLSVRDIGKEIGYVFQNPEHQFVTERVYDEIAFSLKWMKVPEKEIESRVREMLGRFGLLAFAEMNPFQLSHGQKRRLSVASMLVTGQKLLILDEPTFGQDQNNAVQLMDRMKQLQFDGHTIIIISHDMGLIAEYADHVAVMKQGKLCFHGTTQALFAQPDLLSEAGLTLPTVAEIAVRLATRQSEGYSVYSWTQLLDLLEQKEGVVEK